MKTDGMILPLIDAKTARTIAVSATNRKAEEDRKRRAAEKQKRLEAAEKKFKLYMPGVALKIKEAADSGALECLVYLPDKEQIDPEVKDRIAGVLREHGYGVTVKNHTTDHGDSAAPATEHSFELRVQWQTRKDSRE